LYSYKFLDTGSKFLRQVDCPSTPNRDSAKIIQIASNSLVSRATTLPRLKEKKKIEITSSLRTCSIFTLHPAACSLIPCNLGLSVFSEGRESLTKSLSLYDIYRYRGTVRTLQVLIFLRHKKIVVQNTEIS
jgi:hypothetical protein